MRLMSVSEAQNGRHPLLVSVVTPSAAVRYGPVSSQTQRRQRTLAVRKN